MARRKHPWYKPVGHRVADKYRGTFASFFYETINTLIWISVLWMLSFFALRFASLQYPDDALDPVTFGQWVDWTFNDFIFPAIRFISDSLGPVISGAF